MRFAAWNVAHQIRLRPLPPEVLRAFLTLEPDVILFTEYVPGPDHERVVADLTDAGFAGIHISDRVERQNQVLVATRMASERGPWIAPAIRPQVPPNFLQGRCSGPHVQPRSGWRVENSSKKVLLQLG